MTNLSDSCDGAGGRKDACSSSLVLFAGEVRSISLAVRLGDVCSKILTAARGATALSRLIEGLRIPCNSEDTSSHEDYSDNVGLYRIRLGFTV